MTKLSLGRASAIGVAILFLSGCGGSSSTATIPTVTSAVRETGQHGKSGTSDLVYATGAGETLVFSYPKGTLIDAIHTGGSGNCSDAQGNVFVTNAANVYEFPHGATSPSATLSVPGKLAQGCAVDPLSNNLAVVFKGNGADVAIFLNEQGTPTLYQSQIDSNFCGYDGSGNLFVNGYSGQAYGFSELPRHGSSFTEISISSVVGQPGQVQWDGKYITYEGIDPEDTRVSQLSISGTSATIAGTTILQGIKRRAYLSWIYGGKIVVPYSTHGFAAKRIGTWDYPKGGKRAKRFPDFSTRATDLIGVTISIGT
jgi:hypothetical protein